MNLLGNRRSLLVRLSAFVLLAAQTLVASAQSSASDQSTPAADAATIAPTAASQATPQSTAAPKALPPSSGANAPPAIGINPNAEPSSGPAAVTGYRQPYGNASLGQSAPLGRGLSVGLMLGMYVGMNTLAYLAWWVGSPPDQFEWIHDGWFERNTYAGGSDKLGHLWGNILMTRAAAGILEEGGWHPRTSSFAGAALSMGTFYVVELRDAFSTGFSKNDMISNVVGAATGVLMREVPVIDKMFDFRVEYVPTPAYFKKFKKKGFNFTEDYTGMTFLFAWHLCTIPWVERSGGLLRFADLVLGYNTTNYKPKPDDPHTMKYQDRFIGFSLNLQRIIDELWMDERHPKWGESAGRTHRFTHFATEFLNLPYTSFPVGTWTTEYRKP